MTYSNNKKIQNRRILKCYGLSAQDLTQSLRSLFQHRDDVLWKIDSIHPECHITLNPNFMDKQTMARLLNQAEQAIRNKFNPYIIAVDDHTLEETVGELLRQKDLTVAIAESCTGGRIGDRLTNNPGSSLYFLGGVIAYSNSAKQDLLGVSPDALRQYGAVSSRVAEEMAEGAQKRFQSHLALSVTGIAGPEGGSDTKPVGTVHIGLATKNKTYTRKYLFRGTRQQIKQESSEMALDWIRRYINDDPFLSGI